MWPLSSHPQYRVKLVLEGQDRAKKIDRNKKSVERKCWLVANFKRRERLYARQDGNVVGSISPRKPEDANKAKGNWRKKRSKRLYEETKKAADSFPSGKDDQTAAAQENSQASATKKDGPPKKEEPLKKAVFRSQWKKRQKHPQLRKPSHPRPRKSHGSHGNRSCRYKNRAAMREEPGGVPSLVWKGRWRENYQRRRTRPMRRSCDLQRICRFWLRGEWGRRVVFEEGDEIKVTEIDDDDGWWHGKLDGKYGAFPYNFVHLKVGHGKSTWSRRKKSCMSSTRARRATWLVHTTATPKRSQTYKGNKRFGAMPSFFDTVHSDNFQNIRNRLHKSYNCLKPTT